MDAEIAGIEIEVEEKFAGTDNLQKTGRPTISLNFYDQVSG